MGTIVSDTRSLRSYRIRRIIIRLVIGLVVFMIVAYLGIGAFAAKIMTTPTRTITSNDTPATYGLTYQDVRFPARGSDLKIAGWYIPHSRSDRVIVIVHGVGSNRADNYGGHVFEIVTALYQRNFAVLMIDMRGHGQSDDAQFSFGTNERYDVIGAVDWLKSQGFASGNIGVLGLSMGAAASIGAAADDPDIGALIEDCSYADIRPIIREQWRNASGMPDMILPGMRLMHWLMYGYDIMASRPVDLIGKIAPRPVLIIHGTADDLIPFEHAQQLKAAAPSAEFWAVPGAAHGSSYGQEPAAYLTNIGNFFDQHLKPSFSK